MQKYFENMFEEKEKELEQKHQQEISSLMQQLNEN